MEVVVEVEGMVFSLVLVLPAAPEN